MTTTADEIRELVDSYVTWLRRGVTAEAIGEDLVELTTPFMDRHNDHLQIYVRRVGGTFELSDAGETIADLASSGVGVSQPRRRETIAEIARGFGVNDERGVLQVGATASTLGQRTHALIQTMLAVNDLYLLSRSHVASFFREDVEAFLTENGIRFSSRVKLAGKSGYDHAIDFLIPRSQDAPERLLQAVASPSKAVVSQVLWSISDSKAARAEVLESYAVLNDSGPVIPPGVLDAFENYDTKAVPWSNRSQLVDALAA